ncbi:MAG: hypothetical protein E6G60_16540, partial [Actinobacteria bacterium]
MVGGAGDSADRGDVDDRTAAVLLQHRPYRGAARQEHVAQVAILDLVPAVLGPARQRAPRRVDVHSTRDVDEHVEPAKLRSCGTDHAVGVVRIAQLGDHGGGALPSSFDLASDIVGPIGFDVDHRDRGAGGRERQGRHASDAAPGTGNDGNLILQHLGGVRDAAILSRVRSECSLAGEAAIETAVAEPVPDALFGIAAQAAVCPDRVALVCGDRRVTFSELDRRVNRAARVLRARGVGDGSPVAIALRNGPEHVEVALAAARLGAAVVPASWRSTEDELEYLVED